MLRLLLKTFAREFYSQHLGLFCFAFYILFGTVEGGQLLNYHLAMLNSISGSIPILFACCVLWLLYSLKCILFINKELALDTYRFIKVSAGATEKNQHLCWAGLYFVLFLPVLLYMAILVVVALSNHNYLNAFIILLFSGMIVSGATFYTYRRIIHSFSSRTKIRLISLANFQKPYWAWPLLYVWRRETLMFIICKVLSFVLFKGILWMFTHLGNDVRIAQIGLLAAIISHSMLITMLIRHEASNLAFTRSLPINRINELAKNILVLSVLFLPELILYTFTVHAKFADSLSGIAISLPSLFLMQVLQYRSRTEGQINVILLFSMFICLAMLIIAKHALLFNFFQAIVSGTVFYHQFYKTNLKKFHNQ